MPTSSSSSEEEFEKFKEAVDENFLPKNLYENGTLKEKCEVSLKPSLRSQNHEIRSTNPFTLKVTPEFQKHVAEHLSKLLDEVIDDSEIVFKRRKSLKKPKNSGVKLLQTSKNFLVLSENKNTPAKSSNVQREKFIDTIDFEKRAKEVAVSPEWVLSKQETKYWAPETKGEIEIVKLNRKYN